MDFANGDSSQACLKSVGAAPALNPPPPRGAAKCKGEAGRREPFVTYSSCTWRMAGHHLHKGIWILNLPLSETFISSH